MTLYAIGTGRNGQHAAILGDGLANLSSEPSDLDCCLLVDEAGSVGSRNLAAGMTKDSNRSHFEAAHEIYERNLDGCTGRLAVVSFAQPALSLASIQLLSKTPWAAERLEHNLRSLHALSESLVDRKASSHCVPLCTLARENEGDSWYRRGRGTDHGREA